MFSPRQWPRLRKRNVKGHKLPALRLAISEPHNHRAIHAESLWTACGCADYTDSFGTRLRIERVFSVDCLRIERDCGWSENAVRASPRTVICLPFACPWSRTGHHHSQRAGLWRGYSASKLRLLRRRRILTKLRSKACPALKASPRAYRCRNFRINSKSAKKYLVYVLRRPGLPPERYCAHENLRRDSNERRRGVLIRQGEPA